LYLIVYSFVQQTLVGICCNWDGVIKTTASGNKGEQKRQTAEQLWQKNGNYLFVSTQGKKLGIVRIENYRLG